MIKKVDTTDVEVFKIIANMVNDYSYEKEYLIIDYSFSKEKAELKIIHINDLKHNNIISIYYDEYEVASYLMDAPYYELYNVITGDTKRYYENEIDILITNVETIIKEHYSVNEKELI